MTNFRPIQYLGNKLRVLDEICDATESLVPSNGHVADLFTGSTIVAQALADRGYKLAAVDSQLYSKVLATAFLSIGRQNTESSNLDEFIDHSLPEKFVMYFKPWEEYAAIEDKLLTEGDSPRLRKLYSSLPLIWRDEKNPYYYLIATQHIRKWSKTIPLITSIYAGSYFGLRQSLELDRLRQTIFALYEAGSISPWQMNAALASLISAASAAVHSAGKHFAQPLSTSEKTSSSFKDQRLLQDRNISIKEMFVRCVSAINNSNNYDESDHTTHFDTAESFITTNQCHFDLFYIDPPYTAQQYSRFYHVLETLCNYEPPNLLADGRISSGLYPTDRFKSAFCSKVKALPAFEKIVSEAKRKNTSLLISYSHSLIGSNGNARMISLDELLNACCREFGAHSVESWTLKHRYRQFNSTRNANENRVDPEVLITCRSD